MAAARSSPDPLDRKLDSATLYRLLTEAGGVWFVVHDLDGTILQVGPALAEALGYAEGELVGRPLPVLNPSHYRSVADRYLERMRVEPRSEAMATLVTRAGERRRVYWWSVRVPAPDGRDVVLATAMNITRLEAGREASTRRSQMALAVAAAAHQTSASLEPTAVAQAVVDSLGQLLDGVVAAIYRYAPRSSSFDRVATTSEINTLPRLPEGEGLAGLALRERRTVVVANVLADPRVTYDPELRATVQGIDTRSMLGVPLLARGVALGSLIVGAALGRRFDPEEIELAEALAEQAALALERADLFAQTRAQAEQYRELLDGSIQGLYIHQDGIIVFASRTLATMLGYASVEELVGRPFWIVVAPDERARLAAYREDRLAGRPAPTEYDFQALRKDERALWVEAVVSIVMWQDRPAIMATWVDVSERKQAEAAHARAEAAGARRTQMALAVATAAHDASSSLEPAVVAQTVVNSLAHLLSGVFVAIYRHAPRASTLVGVATTSEHETAPVVLEDEGVAGLAFRERRTVVVENVLTDPRMVLSPELRAMRERLAARSMLGVPLLARGVVLGSLIVGAALGRHFTAAELQLAETLAAQAALALERADLFTQTREQAEQYRVLLDGSIQGLGTVQDGVFVFVSRTLVTMLGYTSAEELVGQPFSTVLAPDERSRIETYRDDRLAGRPAPTQYEFQALRKDGSALWVEAVVSVVTWQGRPAVMGAWVDVSERKQAESARARAEFALRRREQLDALGELTAGVAHNVNNILAIIGSSIALARAEAPLLPSGAVDSLERAARSTRRGAELVQRLVAFARRQPLAPRPVLVEHVISGLTVLLGETLGPRIKLVRRPAPEPWTVVADPVQLEACLLNLVTNARDAMPSGGTVTFASSNIVVDEADARGLVVAPGDYVALSIADDGVGIPPDVLARVVEPFFTSKPFGKGSGLGLSTVEGFARQSGGALVLASVPGHGTTVTLYLPRAAGTTADAAGLRDPDPLAPRRAITVLVLEDEDDMRATVTAGLTRAGYRVLAAATAEEALTTLAGSEPVDVLFSDVVLAEGSSGPAVAMQARAWRPDLKVLFTSGYPPAELGDLGSSDAQLLAKPYDFPELERRLGELAPPARG